MNNEVKKVFFIVNKYSGTGCSSDLGSMIMETCQQNGAESIIEYTGGPTHATTLAAQAIDAGFENIIAVGGDGTVNEVARALVNTPVVMGIIPKGSGNGLARHLGIPMNIRLALKGLFTSEVVAMDTFRINGRLSLNVSGIGFDGYIASLFGADKKRGFQGYSKLIFKEYMPFPEFEARITVGEKQLIKKAFVIAIANSSQYGNHAKIAPGASVFDKLLNISILKKIPPYRLDFIYSFFTGTVDRSVYCETAQVRNTHIQVTAPIPFHIDGEPAGKAEQFTIELVPASLQIRAPLRAGHTR